MKLVPRLVNLLTLIIFTVGLFGCDYASKSAAKASLEGAGGVPVAPNVLHGAVELRYAENRDVAFNALERLGVPRSPSVLLGLSGVAAIGIVALAITAARRRKVDESNSGDAPTDTEQRDRLAQVGLAVVISGALGNIVDRIARGYVVDFIHVKGWPIFNVADIAVCVGMGMIFLSHLWKRRAEARPPS